jgi:hypothetical protein
MDNKILQGIPTSEKISFLEKLQSGKFTLADHCEPQPKLDFDLQPDGLFKCKQDGRILTGKEVTSLPGYRLAIEIVNNKLQVNGEKPPQGYVLMPYTQSEYLNSLLKCNSETDITYRYGQNHFPTEILSELSTDELKQLHSALEKEENHNK